MKQDFPNLKSAPIKEKELFSFIENEATVVKRSGSIVPFKKGRILRAITAAFRDTKKIDSNTPLPEETEKQVERLTGNVVEQAALLFQKGVTLTVEGIQDMVEITLMKNGYHDVAKDYIIYRDHHKAFRADSPQNLKVYRKGETHPVRFNPIKVSASIRKAFLKFFKVSQEDEGDWITSVNIVTEKALEKALFASRDGQPLKTEQIEEMIEESLMEEGFFKVAKEYIISKTKEHLRFEEEERKEEKATPQKEVLSKEDASKKRIEFACRGVENLIDVKELLESTTANFYDGIQDHEIDFAAIMAARMKVEKEPAYSKVAARLLLDVVYREAMNLSPLEENFEKSYKEHFPKLIEKGVEHDLLNPDLLEVFDLEKLQNALKIERDDELQYLGLQTLYDRYLIHYKKQRIETPQTFWMRVAMGLALKEDNPTERAIEFYNVLSQFLFISSTPTLFNSGTLHSQLSSCYLSTVEDDLEHIFKVIGDDAQLSKWAGGIGNDWTNVRATGAPIKGTNGESQGIIPFLKVANDTALAVNQGGKRKGAMCAYLETWHLDIEDFLELRKNTGDERRRTHDMNTANWIPDLFIKRVIENGHWTLFSPSDTPDLHHLYGKAFDKRYVEYEQKAEKGEITLFKKVEAIQLWRKMLSMLFETGHPWITFKDPSNIRSPQDHKGVVHNSNLCTEILLNTSKEETAVCNLGSINLAKMTNEKGLNEDLLKQTIFTAIRMLDNVIDINFYPTKEAQNANLTHRPIGLGLMGFQDALNLLKISYASHEAVLFSDTSMEMIAYYALLASSRLAKERGTYASYKGSKWDRGLLPIDTLNLLQEERGGHVDVDREERLDWSIVRKAIEEHGMRNSNTMAIAPTATIANIAGVTPSIEPSYKHLYVKSNLSGEFTIVNPYLVAKLKEENLWNEEMLDDLKYYDGSLLEIEAIPESLKQLFPTCFEIDPEWIIECASRRQKWIDMGQSLNLYLAEASGKKLNEMYLLAWEKGLKTTYYLRSQGATQVEKSTTDINKRGLQPRWMKSKSASSNIQVDRSDAPKSCSLEEGCESCQ